MNDFAAAAAFLAALAVPSPTLAAQSLPNEGTWVLRVQGDATALRVTAAAHKPFALRPTRRSAGGSGGEYHVRLVDSQGAIVASTALDVSRFDMDPDHVGHDDRVIGDIVRSRVVDCTIKVPARADVAAFRIEHTARDAAPRVLGTTPADTVLVLPESTTTTVRTLVDNGPPENRYDIVILGDGYRDVEMARFEANARTAIQRLFTKTVFATYEHYFNVHTVFRASNESGADHPDANPPVYRDTAYDATYAFGGTARCLYINGTGLATADSMLAPDVEDSIMVLVNDTRYGGCGGRFSVSYNGVFGPQVQAHEFGHSFGLLADEYDTGRSGTYTGPEPVEANVTAEPSGAKWAHWIGSHGVSTFEGARYYRRGMWRPVPSCVMRDLGRPFCAVCNEQLVKQCYREVSAIDDAVPVATSLTVQQPSRPTFAFTPLTPGPSEIQWLVDGEPAATDTTSFAWDSSTVRSGTHTITAQVIDRTELVRSDPNAVLVSRRSWTVDVLSPQPGSYTTWGQGCPGSTTTPCFAINTNGSHFGGRLLAGADYALPVIASGTMRITGFDLWTESRQASSTSVSLTAYAVGPDGAPAATLATGTMTVGPNLAWYSGTFDQPVPVSAGQAVYVGFRVPSSGLTASIASGNGVPWQLRLPGSPWTAIPRGGSWTYRVHCDGAARNVPELAAAGRPEIGRPFRVELTDATPGARATLSFGTSRTSWNGVPLPIDLTPFRAAGCAVLVAGELTLPVQADGLGHATAVVELPDVRELVGAEFHNQFYVFDPTANGLGLAWSNAGTARIGF